MRKITLNLDQLEVESFATVEDERLERGTVHAHGSGLGCASINCLGTNGCAVDPSISADGQCVCQELVGGA